MNQPKLRIGLLLDGYEVPAWAYEALERTYRSNAAEFALVVLNCASQPKPVLSPVYDLYSQIDRKFFPREPDAFASKSLRALLASVPVLEVKPVSGAMGEGLEQRDIERLREYHLDLLVKLGFGNLQGEILTAARHGVWAYHHGDYQEIRGEPAGFWEVVEQTPTTGAALYIAGDGGKASTLLYTSRFSTHPRSPNANRHSAFWAASNFLPRQVTTLHHLGDEAFYAGILELNPEIRAYSRPYRKTPSGLQAAGLLAGWGLRVLAEVYQRLFKLDTWYLAYQIGDPSDLSLANFRVLMPPKDRFWADPMILREGDTWYIFVEELLYQTGRGHLAVIEMDAQGNTKDPVRILEKPYHLSYPFVFQWQGKTYMVPETSGNGTIDLYECVDFPRQWEYRRSLMQGVKAVDTSLFYHEGKWWLFTGLAENPNALPEVELFLYSADSLFAEEWTPHPLNPIVSDARLARPAGKIFTRNGKIYRPAQDCSKTYGYGFRLMEITRLTETEYAEEMVTYVEPLWDRRAIGTHTFATAENLTVVDVHTTRNKFF